MDKTYWQERLQAYLDNELEPADRKAFEQHLGSDQDIAAEFKFMGALKKRLSAYRDSVSIPSSVEQRIRNRFGKPPRRFASTWLIAASTLAAVILVALFLPRLNAEALSFEHSVVRGTISCYGCEVAQRSGLEQGIICLDGHEMGLVCANGQLWRFASDKQGLAIKGDQDLYKKDVEVSGMINREERLIRVQSIAPLAIVKAGIGSLAFNR